MSYKTDRDLDRLKYEIYRKSGLSDYITFKQFLSGENVIQTFSELNKISKNKKKSWKSIGIDYKWKCK